MYATPPELTSKTQTKRAIDPAARFNTTVTSCALVGSLIEQTVVQAAIRNAA